MPDKYQNKPYLTKKKRLKYHDIQLIKLIKKYYKKNFKAEILDVGCASGNLIFNLKNHLPKSNFTGIDVHSKSIKYAKKLLKVSNNCEFYTRNLLSFRPKKKFDIILASGLISFFEDFKVPIKNLIRLLSKKSKSRIFIFGRFNTSNIDTKIKFRNNNFDGKWRDGFNSYSINTISKFLKKNKLKFTFKKFNLPIVIKKGKDLTRSYTLITKNNKKIIANRANIIAEFYYLMVKKK